MNFHILNENKANNTRMKIDDKSAKLKRKKMKGSSCYATYRFVFVYRFQW